MVGCTHRQSSLADHEAVLLSTCHRVELYAAAPDPDANLDPPALAHYLANFHNVPVEEIGDDLMSLEGEDVIRHLFRVASSLDSMVVGAPHFILTLDQM